MNSSTVTSKPQDGDDGIVVTPDGTALHLPTFTRDRQAVLAAFASLDRLLTHRREQRLPEATAKQVLTHLHRALLGGEGCVMAALDERLPKLYRAIAAEHAPARPDRPEWLPATSDAS